MGGKALVLCWCVKLQLVRCVILSVAPLPLSSLVGTGHHAVPRSNLQIMMYLCIISCRCLLETRRYKAHSELWSACTYGHENDGFDGKNMQMVKANLSRVAEPFECLKHSERSLSLLCEWRHVNLLPE